MGIVNTARLSIVELLTNDTTADPVGDYVKKPFYVLSLDVKHKIDLKPIYYVGGSWPFYERRVWFQPQSGGGSITLTGFFRDVNDQSESYNYLTNSVKINPLSTTPTTDLVDLDLRINGKKYKKCFCIGYKLAATSIGDIGNIISGDIFYIYSTIEDYTGT